MSLNRFYKTMFRKYDDLLSVADVTDILCISRHQVYSLIQSNQLHAIKPGNAFLIPKRLLIDYVLGVTNEVKQESSITQRHN